tara:strand:- start:1564 stop:1941 length:378 start_codon:yes stop_codon:yes gene_type:complete
MKFNLIIVFFVITISCQDLVKEKKIVGNYYIISIDTSEESLSYKLDNGNYLGIINSGIQEVVNDNNYIYVKMNKGYYVIPMYLDSQINKYWIDTLKSKLLNIESLKKYPFDKGVDINNILSELNN